MCAADAQSTGQVEATFAAAQARQGALGASASELVISTTDAAVSVGACVGDAAAGLVSADAALEALAAEMRFTVLSFDTDFDQVSEFAQLETYAQRADGYCHFVAVVTALMSDVELQGFDLYATLGLQPVGGADQTAEYWRQQLSNCALFVQSQIEPLLAGVSQEQDAALSDSWDDMSTLSGSEDAGSLAVSQQLYFNPGSYTVLLGRRLAAADEAVTQLPPPRRIGGSGSQVQVPLFAGCTASCWNMAGGQQSGA